MQPSSLDVAPYHLYRITTPVGDYIGVSKNVRGRFLNHRNPKRQTLICDVVRHFDLTFDDDVSILATGSRQFIYELEFKAISIFGTLWPNGLNRAVGGYGCREHLPETRARMSAKARDPARIARLVARNKTTDQRLKTSNSLRGRSVSALTRDRLSLSHQGFRPRPCELARRARSMRASWTDKCAVTALSFGV